MTSHRSHRPVVGPRGWRAPRLLLIATLAMGVMAGAGLAPLGLASDVTAEWAYIPADQRLLLLIDVRALAGSELRTSVLGSQAGRDAMAAFEALTGISVATDVDLVMASFPEPRPGIDSNGPLVIARGRFDRARSERLAAAGSSVAEYRGMRIFGMTDRHGVAQALVFLEPGLVAVGPDALVRRGIDAEREGADIRSNASFFRLVQDVSADPVWAVGRFDELASRAGLPLGVVEQLPQIDWFAASGRIAADVRVQARAEARDQMAAQELRDVLRGFVALLRGQPGAAKDARTLSSSLEIGGEGRNVTLLFSAPPELLIRLHRLAP